MRVQRRAIFEISKPSPCRLPVTNELLLSNEISLFKAHNKEKLDRYKKQLKYEIKWGIVKTE
jgi:hypothetical protein